MQHSVLSKQEPAPVQPRPQVVTAPRPEPMASSKAILIEAWARHAMAASGFGG